MGIFNLGSNESLQETSQTSVSYNTPRPIVASAARVNLKSAIDTEQLATRMRRVQWQSDAWDYYDAIGEIKFTANLVSNVLSRINIFVGLVDDSARIPNNIKYQDILDEADVNTANNILGLLETGDGGTADLLRLAALNLFIAGEFYLVKMPGNSYTGVPEKWEIHSVDEIVTEGSGSKVDVYIRTSPEEKKEFWKKIPKNGYICRMWRKHPRYSAEADSSVRGILDDADDLLLYTREERAVSKSRIAAGILFIPDGLSDASTPDSDADDDSDGTDFDEYDIADDITDALVAPLGDESNVHSVAPLVIRGSDEVGEKIKYIAFNRPTDPMYHNKIQFKLDRILSALDIPKDIAGGLSNVKYSNGQIIEDSLYKSHIEPMVLMICDILTSGFLRPALIANGVPVDVANKLVVWYDPSSITSKPSKSEAANFGIENDLVSDYAWRAANGFAESDAPDEKQYARKILTSKLVLSDPALQANLLDLVLPTLMNASRETSLGNSDPASAGALGDALGAPGSPQEGMVVEDPAAVEQQAQVDEMGGGNLLEP